MSSVNFGQNEWLVDQMYQQYKQDPQSVDAEWRDYFAQNPQDGVSSASAANNAASTPSHNNAQGATQAAPTNAASAQTQSRSTATGAGSSAGQTKKEAKASNDASAAQFSASPAIPSRVVPPAPKGPVEAPEPGKKAIKGSAKAVVKNMDASLEIPTATSVRDMPAKLMFENRAMLNETLTARGGGKISFTHIIGFALVKAVMAHPDMNNAYEVVDGKPTLVTPEHINLGLAIDMTAKNGSRSLVVAAIKEAESLSFSEFVEKYEDVVRRGREGKLTMDDFSGVTISLTNPGGIGTRHSVPRLTKGQGAIIGVGSMDYPAEFAGASEDRLGEMGIGKLVTITSTYDHRIIQGAESGEFLRTMSRLLINDDFWDEIFEALRVPYAPVRWTQDVPNIGVDKSTRVMQLIEAYRSRGHLIANTNPLHWTQPGLPQPSHKDLQIETHGLTLWDYDRTFNVGGFAGRETMTLREVLATLRKSYTLKVGSEYAHILDAEERQWLQNRIEAGQQTYSPAEQKFILQKLNSAEAFENFLQTKYVGQKRFSLEGAETLIPMMDAAIDQAAGANLDEVVIGMPHRGRLNVLANIVGKPYSKIFTEFEGNIDPAAAGGSGDVKYHLGATGHYDQMFGDGEIDVYLAANPSHLEAVNPVMEGIARAKADKIARNNTVMPLLLHGDAAFAGLGIVQETINLYKLDAYDVGGTVHIVVNNQIGFTTTPDAGRSTHYSTDLAKGFDCPVFHVNGDDPEACVWVARLAVDYRNRYGKDVFIDLIAYRRRGHNEADDPSMTQPLMYNIINEQQSSRAQYTETLIGRGDLSEDDAERVQRDFHEQLETVFNQVREAEKGAKPKEQSGITSSQELPHGLETNINRELIEKIGDLFYEVPDYFKPHPRVAPVIKRRHDMSRKGNIDWGFAELLAFGSLVEGGKTVRLAGEDSLRGTFTQRHAVLFDHEDHDRYSPLEVLAEEAGNGGKFAAYNSALTEYAGMGFEYGYSVGNKDALVAWEAQFGDFANGAQTVIDEYVSSGEAKWGQISSLVLLLPHGYEGQGPDHSSARIERFLQMSAEGSWTIAQPSTPANYFHLLRRHALGSLKRPLVVFTPKSMLRNKAAVSSIEDFTEVKKFKSVIDDPNQNGENKDIKTVLMCSGKIYWDLEKKRAADERDDVAIVRVEMLHPIPFNRIKETLANYPNAEVRWVQDEPANQGPWPFLALNLPEHIEGLQMKRVSRRAQSSTATGVAKVHQLEQKQLLEEAFE
ncbi:multifunctional oxoglutarate decarboxylase/oxoglutarate dehydrogenase thiamine pyrophosphate-binding subunit/dihydrolipoyllysine-residue succinyltransferase subunit [Corynebacterium sp. 320]|uniref:multifunctional oxoglutarate decarboxylase/oxoglutarate dehydrogenase thiamine pyrophosphate-binding subunit/dihydrolipoyllysine-residue succinyltransferase subunit n=1 Tax=Corynebacterium TaxID=1716 RepID=UPI00125CD298|nr:MULTISPECIES: multifunctional oxoglutarate decarboxylase/oxoglutarate dehydrogenase thiamine pyrophosphate-binding subunit/dihydrolipoyllysine-residue succinyltransferase subunit [Corynebacterium]KAB1503963.1 multifunctional oxoglutarate decarboxylase/oxoglutarate dehydrogenase thiamine pyrophosphate-binding subunit/dihydrolipoyllysine-residue succinyltransferase subunit [Corynebacterium sp. 320]KAB1552938.1 multifunctional oxoglutarate decarboxylase/oxoglutarate dehydrogenase thiamine pyropho